MRSDLQKSFLAQVDKKSFRHQQPYSSILAKDVKQKITRIYFFKSLLSLDCLLTFIDSKTVIDSIERGF